jgi:4-hydroxybenzoate polyprenyltransferase
VVVAALLGVSAHFANTLPDLLEDRATGVKALPHIVGQKISALVISTTAILASSIAVYQSNSLAGLIGVIGLTATIVLAGIASVLSLRPTPPRAIFPLLVVACLVNAILLMLGVGPIEV